MPQGPREAGLSVPVQPATRVRVTSTAAKIADVITPEMLAPSACAMMIERGLHSVTSFCATLAVVGTQDTAAMPITGLYFPPDRKYST